MEYIQMTHVKFESRYVLSLPPLLIVSKKRERKKRERKLILSCMILYVSAYRVCILFNFSTMLVQRALQWVRQPASTSLVIP